MFFFFFFHLFVFFFLSLLPSPAPRSLAASILMPTSLPTQTSTRTRPHRPGRGQKLQLRWIQVVGGGRHQQDGEDHSQLDALGGGDQWTAHGRRVREKARKVSSASDPIECFPSSMVPNPRNKLKKRVSAHNRDPPLRDEQFISDFKHCACRSSKDREKLQAVMETVLICFSKQ